MQVRAEDVEAVKKYCTFDLYTGPRARLFTDKNFTSEVSIGTVDALETGMRRLGFAVRVDTPGDLPAHAHVEIVLETEPSAWTRKMWSDLIRVLRKIHTTGEAAAELSAMAARRAVPPIQMAVEIVNARAEVARLRHRCGELEAELSNLRRVHAEVVSELVQDLAAMREKISNSATN